MMLFSRNCTYLLLLIVAMCISPEYVMAADVTSVSHQVHATTHFQQAPTLSNVYFSKSFSFPYKSGRVVLSSTPDGTGPITFFNSMSLSGTSGSSGDFLFGDACKEESRPPITITEFMNPSLTTNTMSFLVSYRRESCGHTIKINGINHQYADIGDLYVVHFDDNVNKPEPFLIPPWDYGATGLDLYRALSSADVYFDHTYPLRGTSLFEPQEATSNATLYNRSTIQQTQMSGSNGYSWGKRAKLNMGDRVIASASGTATYIYNKQDGHTIRIDHGNGYQTRYYHLQSIGLGTIASRAVVKGETIGFVGVSGDAKVPNLYFVVVRDKNKDGNFDDNIPDGLVDPFGWRSTTPDPWVSYGGSHSYYLWEGVDRIQSRSTLHRNDTGYNLTLSDFRVVFPKYAVETDTLIQIHLQQPVAFDKRLYSVGSSMIAHAYHEAGQEITQFSKMWDLNLTFKPSDIARFSPPTLSFYSRKDTSSSWEKETTTIDLISGTAKSSINHMTEFALMGEKLDNQAPVTTANISGTLHSSGVYTSNLSVILTATDGPSEYSQGIDYILYKIGTVDWATYVSPFTLAGSGSYLLSYFSADKDNNVEATQSATLTIDFTPLTPTNTPTPTSTPTPSHTPTPTRAYSIPIVPYLSSTPTPTFTPTPTITVITQPRSLPPPDLSNKSTQDFLASSDSENNTPTSGVLGIISSTNSPSAPDETNSAQKPLLPYWVMGMILMVLGFAWWNIRKEDA
ncbi:MAG: M23 family metallopeptidase [bacterium]|nr:M23 family metallopeptidase [bacterium]